MENENSVTKRPKKKPEHGHSHDDGEEAVLKRQKREKKEKKYGAAPSKAKRSKLTTCLQILGLFSLLPITLGIPYILTWCGELIVDHLIYLVYLWSFYTAILLFVFFYWRKNTITLNSFGTQLATWGIFTLGAYVMVDLPKFLPPHLRQSVLYVWCSLTMIFNILYFFYDDTDHKKEEEKERKLEEKEKKRDEKLKKKWAEMDGEEKLTDLFHWMPKKVRLVVNILMYVLLIGGVAYWAMNWYHNFQERLESQRY